MTQHVMICLFSGEIPGEISSSPDALLFPTLFRAPQQYAWSASLTRMVSFLVTWELLKRLRCLLRSHTLHRLEAAQLNGDSSLLFKEHATCK